jgi:DMSO/TMAO reductase YedYZ molybdopterin-dependent catalytic subunit
MRPNAGGRDVSDIDPADRVARLRRARPARPREDGERIPPGQYQTRKYPVLSYGPTPVIDLASWRFSVTGLVAAPLELTWAEFTALPTERITVDIHCVTRWSMLDAVWEGVPFAEIVGRAEPLPEARFVMQHSYGGYTANLPLDDLVRDDVLLAYRYNDAPLDPEHGGPMRLVVPHRYFWKSAKWLNRLEFLGQDRPGFWEQYGYHNRGDPWTEERFG